MIPKNLFLLWDKPREEWPELIEFCISLWEQANPDWNVVVFNEKAMRDELLHDFSPEVIDSLAIQAKSDILRAKLLTQYGGVWADATCMPHFSLDEWISEFSDSDFTAPPNHSPGRPVCSWFLVSAKNGCIVSRWYEALKKYWDTPKILIPGTAAATKIIESSWEDFISDYASKTLRIYPYLFFHYTLAKVLYEDSVAKSVFDSQVKMKDGGYGYINRNLSRQDRDAAIQDMKKFVSKTPLITSKLNWKVGYKEFPYTELRHSVLHRAGVA